MIRHILLLLAVLCAQCIQSQKIPLDYTFGEKYSDAYRYSNLLSIEKEGDKGYVLIRAFYRGLVLSPKGYIIERYNRQLKLVSESVYKIKGPEFINSYTRNGQVYLLFLEYDEVSQVYEYTVHRAPLDTMEFTRESLVRVRAEAISNPLDRNQYNRDFSKGFSSTVLFDDAKRAFVISTHYRKNRKEQSHLIHVFDASLRKLMTHDLSQASEQKNYALESMTVSGDLSRVYLMGKAYYRKKRFSALERRFQYEMIQLSPSGSKMQTFDQEGKYSEGLQPILNGDELICMGFYANRRNHLYNGLAYFSLNPVSLELEERKYHPFPPGFMFDKFGKEGASFVKNLVFKGMERAEDGSLHFNAEEYFVTTSIQANSSGGRLRVKRYHHNDIVSAKLDPTGDLQWARNINKSEVTQGDGAYASYSSLIHEGKTYFFISTAADNPQRLNKERLVFKQGLTRNRNVFAIQLDQSGEMHYQKVVDAVEARLPLMVSTPYIDELAGEAIFYAKRGNKKQLVRFSLTNQHP